MCPRVLPQFLLPGAVRCCPSHTPAPVTCFGNPLPFRVSSSTADHGFLCRPVTEFPGKYFLILSLIAVFQPYSVTSAPRGTDLQKTMKHRRRLRPALPSSPYRTASQKDPRWYFFEDCRPSSFFPRKVRRSSRAFAFITLPICFISKSSVACL